MPSVVAIEPSSITREKYERDFLVPREPLVLRGAVREMPAVGKWNVDFFAQRYAARRVPVDGSGSGKEMRLDEYVRWLRTSAGDSDDGALYMRNLQIFEHFPELKRDFKMPWIAQPNWLQSPVLGDFSGGSWRFWVELFLSGAGSRFPFVHMDPYYTHAWSVQLSGRKRFYLWPPEREQHAKLLRGEIKRQDPTPIGAETELAKIILDRPCYQVELGEGDLLFIPAGWWHTTETQEASVTLGGNFVEASNWHEFRKLYLARNPAHTHWQAVSRRISSAITPTLLSIPMIHKSYWR